MKRNKQNTIHWVIAISSLLVVLAGITYWYFSYKAKEKEKNPKPALTQRRKTNNAAPSSSKQIKPEPPVPAAKEAPDNDKQVISTLANEQQTTATPDLSFEEEETINSPLENSVAAMIMLFLFYKIITNWNS